MRFLVEEAEFLDAPAGARWLRKHSGWSDKAKRRWEPYLKEPFTFLPLDPDGEESLPLTHTWSERWNAPIYFFRCPLCWRRARRLLRLNEDDHWACRQCHRAKYVSQLQSIRGRGLAHFRVVEHLRWLLSRPGPRTRTMVRLAGQADKSGLAFDADMARFFGRVA